MTTPAEHLISVDGSDVRFACAEGDTLLRAALRAGVGLAYECNSGGCGSCRYDLVEGEMHDRRPDAPGLSPRDRRKGRKLACQSQPRSDCTIKVGQMVGQARHRPFRQTAQLRSKTLLTHDMQEFVFAAQSHAGFRPGQYAMITLPDGQVERAYSMSNLGNCYGEWKFVVKRMPGGRATAALFDDTEVGSEVTLDGPFGHAYLREDGNRRIVCAGGGSGLGAMISIVLGVAARPDSRDWTVHLFCGGRTRKDLHIPESIAFAGRQLGALNVHTAISDEHDDGVRAEVEGAEPFRGFLHEAVLDRLAGSLTDFTYYAAGPPAMTDALARALVLDAGVAADHLHYDRFC
ncbi:2Fe-2S iron-sulfur cluster-binding protein [Pseudonocardia petroleophila]|uniref:2Fe-2S iron-sulfur cluster binding domain-containing protein n=2 Tax=Pseudonocardia petroleophila TaxID=37331 RepID=A0A7G7MLP9_9PSEU|nr:2Fe-2S iron-sulfur cluster binding domain-containing protein [Pseudonocardia petroleophila]QNG53710.1 2Fe-2S iron-sulfur cluster binding domain-containing protein [Pseudonocardia petroleophila]